MVGRALRIVLLALLVMVACTTSGADQPAPHKLAAPSNALQGNPLNCNYGLERVSGGQLVQPGPGYMVIDNAVAIFTAETSSRVLQAQPSDGQGQFFAKTGLLIHRGKQAEILASEQWKGRLSFTWGRYNAGTEHLAVLPCSTDDPQAQWLFFSGVYQIDQPACVEMIVRTGDSEAQVPVPIGAPCPGA